LLKRYGEWSSERNVSTEWAIPVVDGLYTGTVLIYV
jgi:hypothetical protein